MAQVIPESWQVPERFRQRIGNQAGRQRAMIDGGHLLLILHDVPLAGQSVRSAKLFWRNPSGEWRAPGGRGDGLGTLKRHMEAYQGVIHELDEKVDKSHQVDELFQIIRSATPLGRSTRNMHKALQEAREGIDDKEIISLRDSAGDLERAIDLVLLDAKNALDHLQAKANEEQAQFAKKALDAQHKLNLLAAVFFPVTAVASIIANSMHTGLEDVPFAIFWVVIAFAFAIGFLIRGSIR